ncbi:MAG: hypothetical protein AABX29_05660 [Nanoarchaeota archaeon]
MQNTLDIEKPHISLTDILNGLIAISCQKLRERKKPESLTYGHFFEGMHSLASNPRFKDYLQYLDFRVIGDSHCSKALGDYLFQAGTWGFIQTGHEITVPEDQARRRITDLEKKYGQQVILLLDSMSEELLRQHN